MKYIFKLGLVILALAFCAGAVFAQDPDGDLDPDGDFDEPDVSVSTGLDTAGEAPINRDSDGPNLGAGTPRSIGNTVMAGPGQPEYMALVPVGQEQAAAEAVIAAGGQFLRQRSYTSLGRSGLFFTLGPGVSFSSVQEFLSDTLPLIVFSRHHVYRFAQGNAPVVYAHQMVGLVQARTCGIGGVTLGMIDGPVNANHPALAGVAVTVDSVLLPGEVPPSIDHGTAVAALMAGQGGALTGLANGARVHAVSAFASSDRTEGATTEALVAALDLLVSRGVRIINMSFVGPPSQAYEEALAAAASRGVVLVAAAGNNGAREALYPAGSPSVIAVTAIDSARQLYRRANTGGHIEFAAPGVDVFVASANGGTYRSGTSYAAPVVTALVARLSGGGSVNAARAALRAGVVDLGSPGRDGEFGWGLVRAGC